MTNHLYMLTELEWLGENLNRLISASILVLLITIVSIGCIAYEVGYQKGRVIVQFYPDMDQDNATKVMTNLSQQYNFTIEKWNLYSYEFEKDDTPIEALEVYINVTTGREKWYASEIEKNESVYKAMLDYYDG